MKYKILSILIPLFGLLVIKGCTKMEEISPCPVIVADFEYSINPNCSDNCSVSFVTKTSQLPENAIYHWSFGDGASSDEKNPVHIYQSDGTYRVELVVSEMDDCGGSYQAEQSLQIQQRIVGNCIEFNPNNIQIKTTNGNFQIVDGSKIIRDFALLQEEALQSYNLIRHYGISTICTIDAPNFEYVLVNDTWF